jgi:hypothetical protein
MQTSLRLRYDFGTTEGIGPWSKAQPFLTQAYLVERLPRYDWQPDEPRDPPDVVAEPCLGTDLARKRR